MSETTLAIFSIPSGWEMILVLVVALLIFGKRLPDVARSVGKSIVEFKKGIREVKDEISIQSKIESPQQQKIEPPAATESAEPPPAAASEPSPDEQVADPPAPKSTPTS